MTKGNFNKFIYGASKGRFVGSKKKRKNRGMKNK